MVRIVLGGQEYILRFDMEAMEAVEEEFDGLKNMFELLQSGKRQVKTVKKLFVIMANSYFSYKGIDKTVDESVFAHLPVGVINKISESVKVAMSEGMKAETMNGGPADDDVHDVFLEEIEREEKKE